MAYSSISAVTAGASFCPENLNKRGNRLLRVLKHSVYALLLLGGSMGAAPGHLTMAPQSAPAFLPLPEQQPEQKPNIAEKKAGKPFQVGMASWYGSLFHGKTTA